MVNYLKNTTANVIISTRDIFNTWTSIYAKEETLKIGWEHNHFHENEKYAMKVVNSAKNLDFLVLVSKELQAYYKKRLEKTNCMAIYIPNSIDKIPEKPSDLKQKRLIPEKGFLDLVRIYHILYKEHPDWKLDIIGDGVEKNLLEEYLKVHHMEKYVTLHGYQKKDYIDNLLNASSIYLMTSFTESFGIVLIEAMSHGLPCIAFDSAEGARELISSGENGYLIKNRNYEGMVKKITDLINSKEERIRLGNNARKSVEKYTSEKVGEEWFTLIEESDVYE